MKRTASPVATIQAAPRVRNPAEAIQPVCSAVLFGWCASLWIAPHSQTGWIASAGFVTLGAAWIVATGLAVRFILQGDALSHRRWMIRSYALTAAAITLRIYLPLSVAFHWPFSIVYPAIAWLCWIPNALAAEVYLRFVPTPSRLTLPANLAASSRVGRLQFASECGEN